MRASGTRSGMDRPGIRFSAILLVCLICSVTVLGLLGGGVAESEPASVFEREDEVYDKVIAPGEKARFKWDILNPSNATYQVTMAVISDNPDFTGTFDKTTIQIFSGQSRPRAIHRTRPRSQWCSPSGTWVPTRTLRHTNRSMWSSSSPTVSITMGISPCIRPGWA